MTTKLKRNGLLLATGCLVTMSLPVWAQSQVLSVTLTGQSMIRSDIRAHAPSTVPISASVLKGDVVFTNFEATILDEKKGQSPKDGRFLSPPGALEALPLLGGQHDSALMDGQLVTHGGSSRLLQPLAAKRGFSPLSRKRLESVSPSRRRA